ncbi:hypothetical protein HanIR_Chr12g0595881 [Helianthus annuus]|nr:hypothetical protein HanIR_Chr12g0595881 [Helianthus annuus]
MKVQWSFFPLKPFLHLNLSLCLYALWLATKNHHQYPHSSEVVDSIVVMLTATSLPSLSLHKISTNPTNKDQPL